MAAGVELDCLAAFGVVWEVGCFADEAFGFGVWVWECGVGVGVLVIEDVAESVAGHDCGLQGRPY